MGQPKMTTSGTTTPRQQNTCPKDLTFVPFLKEERYLLTYRRVVG